MQPGAQFSPECEGVRGLLIEVNTDETPLSAIADVVLPGPSGEVLPHLVCCVMEMLGNGKAYLRKRTDSSSQTMRQRH